ncbi:MAG: four helix bundle protein [Kiritimatiellales bacterium]|nr:four helix bundle protein [Kiritimatiellales bacterium]
MKIERFEDIEAWKLARKLTNMVYALTRKEAFSRDFELRNQIRAASGSAMHNIAEGFDADSTAEFIRFLRYTKRSCSEVQSELYVAFDERYITEEEFREVYDLAGETRACTKGFIKYLQRYAAENK